MKQYIAQISLIVKDYDEAIQFYTQKLNFELVEDTLLDGGKRWVRIAPPQARETCLLLAKAKKEQEAAAIGNQSGGRVFLFLYTDDFWRDYKQLEEMEITIVRPPIVAEYGTVAVFADLYGNLWDLIEQSKDATS